MIHWAYNLKSSRWFYFEVQKNAADLELYLAGIWKIQALFITEEYYNY